jgi:hypothetical protein
MKFHPADQVNGPGQVGSRRDDNPSATRLGASRNGILKGLGAFNLPTALSAKIRDHELAFRNGWSMDTGKNPGNLLPGSRDFVGRSSVFTLSATACWTNLGAGTAPQPTRHRQRYHRSYSCAHVQLGYPSYVHGNIPKFGKKYWK